jgi:dihydropyrimidinase
MVELTATAPAQLFGLKNKGVIAPGYHADIAIWDLEQPHQISAQTHHMRVDYNLFEGTTVTGVPVTVLRRGEILVNEGEFMGQAGSGAYQFREPMC